MRETYRFPQLLCLHSEVFAGANTFYITIFAYIPNVVADHLPYMADNLPELEVEYN